MTSIHLILNGSNTENGEIPQLDDETKRNLETVQILQSSNITCIPGHAFSDCLSLKSVYIENGVAITSIEDGAFSECKSLKVIELPNSLKTISYYAFMECYSLESIVIPESVIDIEEYAFSDCTSLKLIELPESATNIDKYAFVDTNFDNDVLYDDNHDNVETTRLHQRFDNLPIHRACYHSINTQLSSNALSNLIQQNKQTLIATDYMDMTLLHILCFSLHTTIEMVRIVVEAAPSLLTQTDIYQSTPLRQFLSSRRLLEGIYQGTTPSLRQLLENGIKGEEFDILLILDSHQEISVELSSKDESTGLLPYMTAATLPKCGLDLVYTMAMNTSTHLVLGNTIGKQCRPIKKLKTS